MSFYSCLIWTHFRWMVLVGWSLSWQQWTQFKLLDTWLWSFCLLFGISQYCIFIKVKKKKKKTIPKCNFSSPFLNVQCSHLTLGDAWCFPDTVCSLGMSVKGCPTCPLPIGKWVSTTWNTQDTMVLNNDSQTQLVIMTTVTTWTNW